MFISLDLKNQSEGNDKNCPYRVTEQMFYAALFIIKP